MPVQLSVLAGPLVFDNVERTSSAGDSVERGVVLTCLVGYGYALGQCTACVPGKFKAVNGSFPCVDCPAGSYTVGSESDVTLEQCGVDKVPVRSCAANFGTGAHLLKFEPDGTPLAQ
eukprot:2550884-Rhodomonas_salina.1